MEPRGIRLPREVWDVIDSEAYRRKKSRSEVVRTLVMEHFGMPVNYKKTVDDNNKDRVVA